MTFENTSVAMPSDGNAAVAAEADNAGALARLQADAGLNTAPAKEPLIEKTTVEDVDRILKKISTTTDPVHDFTRDILDGDNNKTVSRDYGDPV
jgi:hypothetical protein